MNSSDKIYVAGHRGLVGSAIVRNLEAKGYTNVIGRTHRELDLTSQQAVRDFFETERPDVVVLAAAKVGGINANNTTPAEFAYENMQIQCNVVKCCHDFGVKKLLFLGSTCIYPKMAPQPIPEDALLTGPLEETNEAYAIAKIAGLEMCKFYKRQYGDDFISCMPWVKGNTLIIFCTLSGITSKGRVAPEKISMGKYSTQAITLAFLVFLAIPPTIMPMLNVESTVRSQLPANPPQKPRR